MERFIDMELKVMGLLLADKGQMLFSLQTQLNFLLRVSISILTNLIENVFILKQKKIFLRQS